MDDLTAPDALDAPPAPDAPPATRQRIFKISGDTIVEDASMRALSLDQVKQRLAQAGYPEAANATVATATTADGDTVISFLPAPGRKG